MNNLVAYTMAFGCIYFVTFATLISPSRNIPSILVFRVIPFLFAIWNGFFAFYYFFGSYVTPAPLLY